MKVLSVACAVALAAVTLHAAPSRDFASAREAAAALPRLHSLVVSYRGDVVFDYFAKGYSANRQANIKSASKSVLSTLTGIAIERGLIPAIDTPIARWFPELKKDADPRKQAITIEDLLTMRSGLESTSGGAYGPWVNSRNWVRYALDRPMVSEPGTSMEYSTGTSHILSAILTKATGRSTHQFANDVLGKPLGFAFARWTRDPQGIYFGGNEMSMTPRQMVRFGELYLNDGRVGATQVLPKSWIDRTRVPRGKSRWGSDREYGYGFWIRDLAGYDSYYAWGYGGQFVFIVPELQLVVVTTSRSDVSRERRDHLGAIYDLVEQSVIPAFAPRSPR
jgi:CubicO group peptidase (beta-lactamase class C family)